MTLPRPSCVRAVGRPSSHVGSRGIDRGAGLAGVAGRGGGVPVSGGYLAVCYEAESCCSRSGTGCSMSRRCEAPVWAGPLSALGGVLAVSTPPGWMLTCGVPAVPQVSGQFRRCPRARQGGVLAWFLWTSLWVTCAKWGQSCAHARKSWGFPARASTCNDDATCVNAFQTPVHKGKAKVVHMTCRNVSQIGRTFIISLSACDLGSQP